jgi:fructokinase
VSILLIRGLIAKRLASNWLDDSLTSLNEIKGNRVVCLGEAVVDLRAPEPVERLAHAGAFVPEFGGSQANTAIGAARFGARALLAGCAGTDPWGEWLRERLDAEGVDVSLYSLRGDVVTTIAFVALSPDGEPSFSIYGGAADGCLRGAREGLGAIVSGEPPGVLAFGSDTLIAPYDREVVAELSAAAAARGWRTLYDPNLRPNRWPDDDTMLEVAAAPLGRVTVVKANSAEATALTGEAEAAAAAAALLALGPRQAVVTMGRGGAVLAGPGGVVEIPGEHAPVVDTTGAGDSVAAVLAAGLARHGEVTPALVEAAMRVAARVVAVRGALSGLPPVTEARAMLP